MNQAIIVQNVTDCLETILQAITLGDYKLFTTVGNLSYKILITKRMFKRVSKQLAPSMKKGYTTTYFGSLIQSKHQIYLWKLSFTDDKDEFVIRMTMDKDKVAGILIN